MQNLLNKRRRDSGEFVRATLERATGKNLSTPLARATGVSEAPGCTPAFGKRLKCFQQPALPVTPTALFPKETVSTSSWLLKNAATSTTTTTTTTSVPTTTADRHAQQAALRPIIVCVDGNIGAGKSTLLKALKENLAATCFQESVGEWKNLLKAFYEDQPRWAFTLQSHILVDLRDQLSEILAMSGNTDRPYVIVERYVNFSAPLFLLPLH
jgi:hypothetical protein